MSLNNHWYKTAKFVDRYIRKNEKDIKAFYELIEKSINGTKSVKVGLDNTMTFWIDTYLAMVQENDKDFIKKSIERALTEISLSYDNTYNQFINQIFNETSVNYIQNIQTINQELIDIQQEPDQEKKKELFKKYFENLNSSRANLVARTIKTFQYNDSYDKTLTKNKFAKQWVSERDGNRVRKAHREADGQIAQLGKFNVDGQELKYPGDPRGSAKNVINCRCYTKAVKI
jgi:hypothetical protein